MHDDHPADAVAAPPLHARLHGLHRGADVSGDVEVVVEERGLRLALPGGLVLPVPWAALDGVAHSGSTLSLFLMGDEVLELEEVDDAGHGAVLARIVSQRACRLGELTLALRGLGSARARPGSDHQRFYGPLLEARRALEGAHGPDEQLAAVNAEALAAALRASIASFAADRFPDDAADRRALEAELLDYADGLLRALARLGAARDAARTSPADERFARWRDWVTELRAVFAEHDRTWIAALPALCDPRAPKGGFWRRLLRRGRGASAVALMLVPALHRVEAQGDAGPRETVRLPGASADSLRARGFDVVFVQPAGVRDTPGTPLVVVGPAERARLVREGFTPEALLAGAEARRRASAVAGQPALVTTRVYRPYDDPLRGVRAWLDSIARALPDLVRIETIGTTWEGRPIVAAHVGRATTTGAPAGPGVLFVATYHAREWIATEMALRLVRHLATSTDARTRALADSRDVWIVPVVNPDGYQYTFTTDRLWRKNRRPSGPSGFIGVDLNRNHAERWGWDDLGSSGQPAAETYRGPSAASEPEVQAVQAFHRRVRPVTSVSYHSFSGLVLYPPGYAEGLLPQDLGVYRAIAGTDLQPAVRDRTSGSVIEYYHPGPGWHLYLTNGDYVDWASAEGTIAMTTELTSGCMVECSGGYYGFEFPDEEPLVEQVFQDNLPMALDVIEAAGEPRTFASGNTGLAVPVLTLESATPQLRLRVPVGSAPAVRSATGAGRSTAVAVRRDSVPSSAVEARFLSSRLATRPAGVELVGGVVPALAAQWRLLLAAGAESGDTGWETTGWFAVASGTAPLAGHAFWESASGDELRSPPLAIPADADTVVVAWWQQHASGILTPSVTGEVRVSVDGGAPRAVARIGGDAGAWYPEQVRLGGLRGRTLRVGFASLGGRWRLDEIQVLAEGAALPAAAEGRTLAVRPSANPVRAGRVTFAWPADAGAGEIAVYDFGGRRVWRRTVGAGEASATWDADAQSLANGAYLVVARAGAREGRLTLYVARHAP